MTLKTIEVLNYKCLRYTRQQLRPFQILVGPNASGKSTFLDVLVFLQDLVCDGLQKAVQKRARSVHELIWRRLYGRFEIVVELPIPEKLRERLPGHSLLRYEISVGTNEQEVLSVLTENLWFVRAGANSDHRATTRRPTLFPQEVQPPPFIVHTPRKRTPPGYRKVMSRTADGRVYVRSETTNWYFPLTIGRDRVGLTYIPEEFERFPASLWLKRLLSEQVHFLMLNSQAMRWPCRPDAPRTLLPDGSNLALVVENLQKDPKQFQLWVDHLQTVLPHIKNITVEERQEDRFKYLVVVTNDETRLPSWVLSDGTLRLFAMTLIAYVPEEKGIYIIEEPETGIHPHAIESVYQSLSSIYDGQVFCATHSPIFLNLAKPEELLCFALTESGATDIVPGDTHPRLREWKAEVPLGDLLASGILG